MITGACFRLISTQKAVLCGILPKFILQNDVAAAAVCHSPFERGAHSFLNTAVFDFLACSPAPIYFCPKSCSLEGCSPPALLTPSLPQIRCRGISRRALPQNARAGCVWLGSPRGCLLRPGFPSLEKREVTCTPWPSPRAVPQEPGPMRTGRALLSSSRAGTGSPDGS